jgi:hypothetical protein
MARGCDGVRLAAIGGVDRTTEKSRSGYSSSLPPTTAEGSAGTGGFDLDSFLGENEGATEGEGDFQAMHDSPGHVRAGDSVKGRGVKIEGVYFSPGELAALVDFVGTLESLRTYDYEQLVEFKRLLEAGIEDAAAWDKATKNFYSKEVQSNEKHFAPGVGDGGQNFRDFFIKHYADGIDTARTGDMKTAKLHGYSAEHYLQDAFSAGHQVSAADVHRQVNEVIKWYEGEPAFMTLEIAGRVHAKSASQIGHYGIKYPGGAVVQIGAAQFTVLATAGALVKGNDGVGDAVREFVHHCLAETQVEVTSKAHPAPFKLYGDHDLGDKGAEQSVLALQAALADARKTLAAPPEGDAIGVATELFDKHCPVPTSNGRATIMQAIEDGTADKEAIITAVSDAISRTILDVMDGLVTMTRNLEPGDRRTEDDVLSLPFDIVMMNEPDRQRNEFPNLDPVVGQPVESYIPSPSRER